MSNGKHKRGIGAAVILERLHNIEQYGGLDLEQPLARAIDGDMDATLTLYCRLNKNDRGALAVALWEAKIPRDAYRVFLGHAWEGAQDNPRIRDHHYVIEHAGNRRRLAAMFRYAQFSIPPEFGETVRVWRGTKGISLDSARKGYSWTTDRNIACWFAHYGHNGRDPLVIVADIPRSEIMYFSDERSEKEAVLVRPPVAMVDGTVADWAAGDVAHQATLVANHEAYMAELAAERSPT